MAILNAQESRFEMASLVDSRHSLLCAKIHGLMMDLEKHDIVRDPELNPSSSKFELRVLPCSRENVFDL